MAVTFEVNGQSRTVDVSPDTPLLWVLRDTLNLTGTKYGCGIAACGACTVHINGEPQRSCVFPVSAVSGKKVTTIERLTGATLCNRPGLRNRFHSAGIVSPVRL